MSAWRIRRATPGDAPAASAVAVRAKASWGYPQDWIDAWEGALTISPAQLESPHALVAVDGEALIGVCVLECSGETATLEHLWVEPGVHGLGVGRALVEQALAGVKAAGVRSVEVEADPSAEPFYQRLGARRTGSVAAAMPGAPERQLPVLEFVLEM